MKRDKELFNLAKQYVMLSDASERPISPYELEVTKEEKDFILNRVLAGGYNIDKFVKYQEMYKDMTIKEYFEFVKTLE